MPTEELTAEASGFIGDHIPIIRLGFTRNIRVIQAYDDYLLVGNAHALKWIGERIDWMDENSDGLTKSGSWTWSHSFLSDYLYLRKLRADLPDPGGPDTVG